jgi:hypothetical protein
MLSRTPVRFRYQDEATELVASAVPIELDANAESSPTSARASISYRYSRPGNSMPDTVRAGHSTTCCALRVRDPVPARGR